jgi:hypothetical protein
MTPRQQSQAHIDQLERLLKHAITKYQDIVNSPAVHGGGGGRPHTYTASQITRARQLKKRIERLEKDIRQAEESAPNPARLPVGKKVPVFAKRLKNGKVEIYLR